MKHSPLFLLLLLLGPASLFAQKMTIRGHILGADGKPMPLAAVHVQHGKGRFDITSITAGADGSYSVPTTAPGFLILRYSGLGHRPEKVPVFIDSSGDITIDVRLSTRRYSGSFDDVKIVGYFNNYDIHSPALLKKSPDGTYSATFTEERDMFYYQLLLSDSSAEEKQWVVNGTLADSSCLDEEGNYISALRPKDGKATVVFDPRKLVQLKGEASFSYNGKKLADYLKGIADPEVRAFRLLSFVALKSPGTRTIDTATVWNTMLKVGTRSSLWSDNPYLLFTLARYVYARRDDRYWWDLIDNNPDSIVHQMALYGALQAIPYRKAPQRFLPYYTRLMECYPTSFWGRTAKPLYNPDRNMQEGKLLPPFAVATLDGRDTISNRTIKGKIYLIDVWATWCGPCVMEMERLHAAYEQFHDRGLEILSISFDNSPERITEFREKKWKMPWLHAYVEEDFHSKLADEFEVRGIPHVILVDSDGRIIATDGKLRGGLLMFTLETAFAQRGK